MFVPEKAMLISASKDKTLKFWRFKQLKVADVPPRERVEERDGLDLGLRAMAKSGSGKPFGTKQKSAYDKNDPLMGEEEDGDMGDTYGKFARRSFEQKSTANQPKPPLPNDKHSKNKKEDSDDDLAGWDT